MSETRGALVIAEAGVNHNGSLERALEMVAVAAAAGADYVKFQSFRSEDLVTRDAPKAAYQARETGKADSQFEMLKALELDDCQHSALLAACAEQGIGFLSTPFDPASLRYLTGELGLDTVKISSGDLTNPLVLLEAGRSGRRVILSTGMATLAEVEEALGVLAYGLTGGEVAPSRDAFRAAWASPEGRAALAGKAVLLHCTTEYPAPFTEVNLAAMATLAQAFGLPTGYSDHTEGIAVPVAAAALGAHVIEKHFTLDRSLPGPDHKASLEPDELAEMVRSIRAVEAALGSPIKAPTASEAGNMPSARKSLTATAEIGPGEPFGADNLTVKRPGDGRSPMDYWELLGETATRRYKADETIR